MTFFMFSCSELITNGDEDRQSGKRNRGRDNRDGSKVDICKEQLYPIHSDECREVNGDEQTGSESTGSGLVDILFVLDTSPISMNFYLDFAFEKRFKSFISIINKLNWRIFFTNAGHSDSGFSSFFNGAMNGEAMKLENRYGVFNEYYLDRTVKYYGDIFKYTITREPDRSNEHGNNKKECSYSPYCQDAAVQPLRALHASFKANKDITRDGADFIAIIISNTDEEPEDVSDITAQEITSEFKEVYGSGKKLSVLSLIVLPDNKKCKEESDTWFTEPSEAHQIAAAVEEMGGKNFSICLKNYSIIAEHIVNLAN